jgi:transcriptional regulator with XRE-family HTH domain
MQNDLMEQIGKRLRGSREQLKYTREQFAEQVGISPQFLAEIENGKKGMLADTLYKLCNRFNFSADYLLFGKITSDEASNPIINPIKNTQERKRHI